MSEILESLIKHLDEMDDETIDGSLVKDVAPMVELEVAFIPRCVEHRHDDWQHDCPQTVLYEHWDNPPRWAIVKPKEHDFEILSEESLKRMRARFLLMNGWYYQHFHTLPHSMQTAVHYNFLQYTQGVPPDPNSGLGRLLRIAGGKSEATT